MTDSIDLRSVATTGNTDTDIDASKLVETNNEQRLVKLFAKKGQISPQLFRSDAKSGVCTLKRRISGWIRLRGLPLTLTRPFPAWIAESALHSSCNNFAIGSNLAVGDCGSSLLLAEALNALSCRGHVYGWRDSIIRREGMSSIR